MQESWRKTKEEILFVKMKRMQRRWFNGGRQLAVAKPFKGTAERKSKKRGGIFPFCIHMKQMKQRDAP